MWPFRKKGLMTPNQLLRRVERKGLEQKYFETIVAGRFRPEDIDVVLASSGESMKRSARSEAYIDQEWQRRVAQGLKPWPNDLKPSRFRFVRAEEVGGRLKITLDPSISYRDAIGSRPAEFEKKFGAECMPNPVAVTTVIRAKTRVVEIKDEAGNTLFDEDGNPRTKGGEEMLLMTLRSKTHDIKPGGYHISLGGLMEIKKDKNPTDTATREVKEETGVEAKPEDLTCLGVFKHGINASTEIIYEAKTGVFVEDILKLHHDDENQVIAIPATARALREWIVVPTHANVGVTNASVLLVGKEIIRTSPLSEGGGEEAAQEWERIMLAFLAGRSEQLRNGDEAALEKRDTDRLHRKVSGLSQPE